ncbi:MAG: lyase family protein, partial [Candidatus Micrarchaeia archaeon]
MLWGGRLQKPEDLLLDYTAGENIEVDEKLIPYDIIGSIAHAKMLAEQGIISEEEGKKLVRGLQHIYKKWARGEFRLDKKYEDVHMNVEHALAEQIGETAGKLHTARSRNDQVNLDMRMYMRHEILCLCDAINAVCTTLVSLAKK